MLWFFALVLAGPQLGERVELFAGEQYAFVAPCFGAEVSTDEKKLTVSVRGTRVDVSATVPITGTLQVKCGGQKRSVTVVAKPLPDLFDGAAPGTLPSLPARLTLKAGERRAFNPSCQVSGLHGQGSAADAELSLIRVLIISARESGTSVLKLSCEGGRKTQVTVTVLP
ncbi:MAG: hypothetical protein ACJ790_06750 [Myxococcaceae bacterium]